MKYEFTIKETNEGFQINDEEDTYDTCEMAVIAVTEHCECEGIEFSITIS